MGKMKDDPAWKLTQELGIGMMEAKARLAAAEASKTPAPSPAPAPEPSPPLVDSEPVAEPE